MLKTRCVNFEKIAFLQKLCSLKKKHENRGQYFILLNDDMLIFTVLNSVELCNLLNSANSAYIAEFSLINGVY